MILQARALSTGCVITLLARASVALILLVLASDLHAQVAAAVPSPERSARNLESSLDLRHDALPDEPVPQVQKSDDAQSIPASPQQQPMEYPLIPPALSRIRLTPEQKLGIYIHRTYGPPAVIFPLFAAGIQMANPKSGYPHEWKNGADAFGRNYGFAVAQRTAKDTASVLTDLALKEDPRYLRATSTNGFARTAHALAFTFIDRSDSGHSMPAISNFVSSAAGGAVSLGILPDGYNDMTHAGQRMTLQFGFIALGNVVTEFQPEWGPWAKKLHIPKLLPAWWVPLHK